MTQTPSVGGFFDQTGGGGGAPSLKLVNVGEWARGTVVEQYLTEAKQFGTDRAKLDTKTGQPIVQLAVILETPLRNWQYVSKIPKVNADDANSPDKHPSEDDGRRTVYVEPWTNLHAAIGAAIQTATGAKGPILDGATLTVGLKELKDVGKGNPLKVWQAAYQAPVAQAQAGFFAETQQAPPAAPPVQQAPPPAQFQPPPIQQQAPPAPPVQNQPPAADPWASQPAAQPQAPAAPAQQDPWGQAAPGQPPF